MWLTREVTPNMHFILEPLFTLFGKRAVGQLLGATLIGAVLPLLVFGKNGETPRDGYLVWCIGGAVAGFTSGLLLLSPRRFLGSVFALLGLAILVVPVSKTDGAPVELQIHLIKFSIAALFLSVGIALLARAWRQLK